MVALIKKLWDIAWDMWEHRNGVLHDSENVVSSAHIHKLNWDVMETFGKLQEELLPAHDRHLIALLLSQFLQSD